MSKDLILHNTAPVNNNKQWEDMFMQCFVSESLCKAVDLFMSLQDIELQAIWKPGSAILEINFEDIFGDHFFLIFLICNSQITIYANLEKH